MKIEVGIGEILDKLSILFIKLSNIKDENKLKNIKYEYNILLEQIHKNIDENIHQVETYIKLININKKLWIIEDNVREWEKIKKFDEEFLINARSVYIMNDQRCYLKTLLNNIYNSQIFEEKSYSSYHYNLGDSDFDKKVICFLNKI